MVQAMLHSRTGSSDTGLRKAPKSAGATETVSVVIVSYNSARVLPGLLDSICGGMEGVDSFDVIVADNRSKDGSAELAENHRLAPRVIRMGSNAGYAAAINAAASIADRDAFLLVLNPDTRLSTGCVRPLLDHARQGSTGVALPRNLRDDGSLDPTLRREPSLLTAWSDALLGGRLASRLGLGEVVAEADGYDRARKAEWATGSALLITPAARAAVGFWDETYFLYSEEVDYQRRIRKAGLDIVFVPQSVVTHVGGEYRANARLYSLLTSNRIRYFARNHGPVATLLFRAGVAAGEAVRVLRGAPNRAALVCALMPLKPAYSFRTGE